MSLQLGGNWTTFSTFTFYKPCFEVAETSMNGFYQLSVFSLLENIARRTAAKCWGMQSTIEQIFGTDLGLLLRDKSAVVQLVSIFFCTNICPAKTGP